MKTITGHGHYHLLHWIFSSPSKKLGYYLITANVYGLLVGTFEIALLFRLTQSFQAILLYYLLYFTVVFFGLLLSSWFFAGRSFADLFRASIVLRIVICVYLLAFYPVLHFAGVLMVLAVLRGFETAAFAYSHHVCNINVIKDGNREDFALKMQALLTLIPIGLPIITGYMITTSSAFTSITNPVLTVDYSGIFVVGLVFSIATLIFSPKLNGYTIAQINAKAVWGLFRNKDLRHIRRFNMFESSIYTSLLVSGGLLTFIYLAEDEFKVGIMNSFVALGATLFFVLLRKSLHQHPKRRILYNLYGTIGISISRIVQFLLPNSFGVYARTVLFTFASPMQVSTASGISYGVYEKVAKRHSIPVESMVIMMELCNFIPRVTVLAIFIGLGVYFNIESVTFMPRAIFLFWGIFGFLEFILLKKAQTDAEG